MLLVRIVTENWHAVERDLFALGKRKSDVGTALTLWELISIVVAAPPGTAVYHAETRSGTYTPEAQLLAGITGAQGSQAPAQPKADSLESLPDYCGLRLDSMPIDEFVKLRQAKMIEAQENPGRDRVILDEFKGK